MQRIVLMLLAAVLLLGLSASVTAQATLPSRRGAALEQMTKGNWKDAYEVFAKLATDPDNLGQPAGEDLHNAIRCLSSLGRQDEADELREKAINAHEKDWRFLWEAANSFRRDTQPWGVIIAGKYHRGYNRGGDGKHVNSLDRDRVRSLQLMDQARKLVAAKMDLGPEEKANIASFYFDFSEMLLNTFEGQQAWRLQTLTDLTTLPDYEEGYYYGYYGYYRGSSRGAPVDEKGNPVFHSIPKSWEASVSDGQRWRWCLLQASELGLANRARYHFAWFLRQQFDVQTMGYGYGRASSGEDGKKDESGPYAVSTLGEDETIARLANGIKRFKLPDEFNFIKLFQTIIADKSDGYADSAYGQLCQVFEDRQQYPKAAQCWKDSIARFGPGPNNQRQNRLDQIVGNWGMFEQIPTQSTDKATLLGFRFRNGNKVSLTATAIKVEQLLGDIKAYLKTNPQQIDGNKINLYDLCQRMVGDVANSNEKYLGDVAAEWSVDLKPRENHFDKRITIATPKLAPGAYLVKATMAGGNTSYVISFVADLAILKKQLDKGVYYYVADAVTGAPAAGAKVDLFGYYSRWIDNKRYNVDIKEIQALADENGQVIVNQTDLSNFQWIVQARVKADAAVKAEPTTRPADRVAWIGFDYVWYGSYYDQAYNADKVFVITDRPVYRPANPVKYKLWINHAQYDQEGKSAFAGRSFWLLILDPKGQKVLGKQVTADDFGGVAGEWPTSLDATLGSYQIGLWSGPDPNSHCYGASSFRIEEYKKPEFEVTVEAPTEPVMLGEKVTATVKAKYYFGSPVTEGKVKYKVLRSNYTANWYPRAKWDWFYGSGYWWYAYDYLWYPGWASWGMARPRWWWWHTPAPQPEVVAEAEVPIGIDGTIKIDIDTAVAKATQGDIDHRYEISAEITDNSRRTITGSGQVLVARKPFKVYTWVDRGYYRTGDQINAFFNAQTLDNKFVEASAAVKLFRITYDKEAKPVETLVERWDIEKKKLENEQLRIKAAQPGQYRLSVVATDEKKHAIEGGYVFVIRDDKFTGNQFRFNDLELVTDKQEYANGDTVRLMLNTNRTNATVLFFVRPSNSIYLAPKVLRLEGKSTIQSIEVSKKDMPNFFVEAVTISSGKIFTETREIIVPPEDRVLNVSVSPKATNPDKSVKTEYKPGEKATFQVKITEKNGEPFNGATVLTVYDKAVEYIAGGSNVPEIKAFFWKWRRSHYPQTMSTLDRGSYNHTPLGKIGMSYLGVFGYQSAEFRQAGEKEGWADHGVALTGSINLNSGGGTFYRHAGVAGPGAALPASAPLGLAKASSGRLRANAEMLAMDRAEGKDEAGAPGEAAPDAVGVEPTIRKNFADTALWIANVETKDGVAEVELPMPENLTTWRTKVWTLGAGTRVGEGSVDVVTRKNLIIRLQAPRFFVQKDEVVLSANVHNYLKTAKDVRVQLELEGAILAALDPETTKVVRVEPNGEARVDWRVVVLNEGTAKVRMKAITNEESDAMEMSFPAYIHGMLKTDSFSGAIRPEARNASLTFFVPKERRIEQSLLEVRYSPSLALAMVDALPYMVDYPYGCTEQTLNRFVPTVITQKILLGMGLNLEDIKAKRTNLNAQEIGNDQDRAKQWKRFDRNPVFDKDEVARMVKAGIDRLAAQQISDGGWGWFSGYGEQSWPHTTAVVVHGLQIARANDAPVPDEVLRRGIAWLTSYQNGRVAYIKAHRNAGAKADNLDAFVYMVLVDADVANAEMKDYLYADRNGLAVYGKSMLGMALFKQKDKEKLDMILQNIKQFLVEDDENQTAYLKLPEASYWWYWYGSEFEAHAYYLKLLARTDPKGATGGRIAKYLINNRKHATYWNSTRDTSICIEALADYIKAAGEDKPDMTLAILLDGKKVKDVKINAENLFTYDNKLVLAANQVPDGNHRLEFVKEGTGPVYFNAYVTNFTLEDHITKAGLEIKVNRKYYKLIPVDKRIDVEGARGQALKAKVEKYQRQELSEGAALKSGDLVEVELEIDSKNDYEYLLFEDMKAAGFEPVQFQSGYIPNDLHAFVEFRDNRVCFFTRWLARGKHSVSYQLRAEIPGTFAALPTKASAMYAPELRGNSDEIKLRIDDVPMFQRAAR